MPTSAAIMNTIQSSYTSVKTPLYAVGTVLSVDSANDDLTVQFYGTTPTSQASNSFSIVHESPDYKTLTLNSV
jgi:hypothetical protein